MIQVRFGSYQKSKIDEIGVICVRDRGFKVKEPVFKQCRERHNFLAGPEDEEYIG
jgi:hypothetical protein